MSLRVGLSPPRASPAIRTAYVGVDVSVSKRKRIPVSVCDRDEAGRLSPLALLRGLLGAAVAILGIRVTHLHTRRGCESRPPLAGDLGL